MGIIKDLIHRIRLNSDKKKVKALNSKNEISLYDLSKMLETATTDEGVMMIFEKAKELGTFTPEFIEDEQHKQGTILWSGKDYILNPYFIISRLNDEKNKMAVINAMPSETRQVDDEYVTSLLKQFQLPENKIEVFKKYFHKCSDYDINEIMPLMSLEERQKVYGEETFNDMWFPPKKAITTFLWTGDIRFLERFEDKIAKEGIDSNLFSGLPKDDTVIRTNVEKVIYKYIKSMSPYTLKHACKITLDTDLNPELMAFIGENASKPQMVHILETAYFTQENNDANIFKYFIENHPDKLDDSIFFRVYDMNSFYENPQNPYYPMFCDMVTAYYDKKINESDNIDIEEINKFISNSGLVLDRPAFIKRYIDKLPEEIISQLRKEVYDMNIEDLQKYSEVLEGRIDVEAINSEKTLEEINSIQTTDELMRLFYSRQALSTDQVNLIKNRIRLLAIPEIEMGLRQNSISEIQRYIDFINVADLSNFISALSENKYEGTDLIQRKKFIDEKQSAVDKLLVLKGVKENAITQKQTQDDQYMTEKKPNIDGNSSMEGNNYR